MQRLTREVRFAVGQGAGEAVNSFAGIPGIGGFAAFFALRATLQGAVDARSGYLQNITEIDRAIRATAIPIVDRAFRAGTSPVRALGACYESLANAWPGSELAELTLLMSPYQSLSMRKMETGMVRFNQRFEFSASHRLHNPALSDEANRDAFGKCNNPHGHGHNYEVQVSLAGTPDAQGQLFTLIEFEKIVMQHAIDRLDHKHLNIEVPAFRETNPSVENIARVIYQWLKAPLLRPNAKLASITVWETPKTWAEYDEN